MTSSGIWLQDDAEGARPTCRDEMALAGLFFRRAV